MSAQPDIIARRPATRPASDSPEAQGAAPASPASAPAGPSTIHADKSAAAAASGSGTGSAAARPAPTAPGAAAVPPASQAGPASAASAAPIAYNHELVREVNAVLERHGIFLGDDHAAPDFSGLLRAHTVQLAHTLVLMQQHGIELARVEKTIQQIAAKLPKGIKLVTAALALREAERLAAEAQEEFLKTS